jgi:peroxiredoxin
MKNITLAAVALFASFLFACQQNTQPEGGYSIQANIEGAEGKAVLARVAGRQLEGVDTVEIKDGKFSFVGKADKEELLLVQLGEAAQPKFFYLFLENEKITVEGKIDSAQNAVVKGGMNNEVWTQFTTINQSFQKTSRELGQRFQQADAETKKLIEDEYKEVQAQFLDKVGALIKENSKAVASVFITANILRGQLELAKLKAIVESFDASLAENESVKELKEEVAKMEKVQIGQIAPDFTMNDMEGNPVQLSSLFGKGYLLIDFWAAWCRPCRAENPNVVEAFKKYNAKGFDILGVSLDKTKKDWEEAVAKDGLTWTNVSDLKFWENSAAQLYAVKSIPHNLLLDKDGKIIAKNLRGEELQAKLAELLN